MYEFTWKWSKETRRGRGVNFFTLIREAGQWRIMSIVWGNERPACRPARRLRAARRVVDIAGLEHGLGAPRRTTAGIAWPTDSVVSTRRGNIARSSGKNHPEAWTSPHRRESSSARRAGLDQLGRNR